MLPSRNSLELAANGINSRMETFKQDYKGGLISKETARAEIIELTSFRTKLRKAAAMSYRPAFVDDRYTNPTPAFKRYMAHEKHCRNKTA